MKKLFSLFVSILLISSLVLSACGKSDNATQEENTGTEAGQTQEPANNETETESPSELGFIKASDLSKIPAASKGRTDTMIIGMANTSGIFSPFFYDTAYDNYIMGPIFESLAKVSQDASIVPDLATWDISEDGLTWTFHIDPKATFSDGTPVTAEDAEFSLYVYLDPAYDGRSDYTVAKIKGTDAYKNGDAATIEGIKVLDEKTLEITVDEVNALTLNYLAVTVVPKHYYGEGFSKGKLDGVKAKNDKPMGSGPYVFTKHVPGQEVGMVANENYWRGQNAKVKNLFFKVTTAETYIQLLEAGETDFEEGISVNKDNVELLKEMGFLDLSLLLNNGYGYIAINNSLPKFQDKRVRQALTYGLDRDSVVYAYSQGYANVIDVPQSKVSWAYPDESKVTHYGFDLDKAKSLLDEAGWTVGQDGFRYKDGEKFVIHFSATASNPVVDALLPIMTENYKELGIDIIAETLEFGAIVDKRNKGEHEMAFLAVGLTSDPDPYGLFHTNGGSNKDLYSNPEVDKLIEAGQKELDKEKRKEIYNQVYQIINEEMPEIFLYQRYNMNTINARLQGFDITPYYNFTNSLNQVEISQ